MKKKPKLMFEVRMNCEYVTEVEAASAQEAIEKAEKLDDWIESWSPTEAEEM